MNRENQMPKVPKLNCVLLALYLSFIIIAHLFVWEPFRIPFFIVGSCLAVVLSFFLARPILQFSSGLSLRNRQAGAGKDRAGKTLLFFAVPLLVLLVYWLAYYPGGFSVDSFNQYRQVVTHRYNDWHPVLQTLLAFWLPLTVSGGWTGSVALFQILLFSAALGYCFLVIDRYAGGRYTACAMAFVLGNPQTGSIAMYPWKDVSFAIGAVLLTAYALRTAETHGAWLKKNVNAAAFVIVLVLTTVFRHNALLFTLPLLAVVLLYSSRKRGLALLAAAAVSLFLVQGPLYSALRVESPDKRQIETLGLPMTVIGAAVTYAPEKTDSDILEFAYRIAPQEQWLASFEFGNFNRLKFSLDNLDVIEEYGAAKILPMMLRCMKSSPYVCLKSLIKLTEGIYTVSDSHSLLITPKIVENSYGIAMAPRGRVFELLVRGHRAVGQRLFPHLFLYYGTAHLLVLIAVLSKCRLDRLRDWKRILFVLPMFAYNYGTSLLLTSGNDARRFFYYTVLLLPLQLLYYFRDEELST